MADPLSLAASIAGLISLADLVFKTTYKFVRAAKDAKDEIQSLLDEINNLASVLRRLEALTSDLEDEGQSFDPTLRNHCLNQCYKTFNRIEFRVKKASESFKKSKFDGIVRQLKWPFSSSETKELLAELSRHKQTISVALLADSMRKIQESLSKSDYIITALGEVTRRVEINTMITINDHKKRILDHFMKVNPQPALQTSTRLNHSETGLWLTKSPTFIRWLETPGSKPWLTGIPGAGKTILAGSVIREALSHNYVSRKIGVAFFFCDYNDPKTWNIVNILGALASQLARQNDESYNLLDAYYEALYPPKGLPQTADADELRVKVSQMCETFDQAIIVVDGLDECDDMTDEVVDSLIQLADYSNGLSMALFSRDHTNIRARLEEDFELIKIDAHIEDVELYVNAEVDKRIRTRQLQLSSVDMKEEIRTTLVRKAAGMCSSLIRKSTDGKYFEFAHFSVREFLEDENAISQGADLQKYRIHQQTTNTLLATQCLRFLQMENFDKLPKTPHEHVVTTVQRDETYPFYRHAALLWITLTKDGFGESGILDLAKSLFQPSKRAYFMCWAIEVFNKVTYATRTRSTLSETQAWRIVNNPSFQPLHMAAALILPEICGFLICSASDVNQKLDTATSLDLAFMSILAVPGLAEMSGTSATHRSIMTNGRNQFLPSTQRRDMTIDCLMHAGARPSDHLIPPNTLTISSITCLFASIFNDLYPIYRCLCSHITPSVSDVQVLQEWLVATSTSNYVAEVSTRMLLKLLSSTGAYSNDWGAELGRIVWTWAQECGFSLTRDLSLIGSSALMSDDALVSQLVSAVCSDNIQLLKYCFKDRRLRNQVRYSGPANELLHLAVKHNAFAVFKALVIAGFDPYAYNYGGDLPIHLCERQGSLRPLRTFKDLGISLISQNQDGYNVLHYWAQDRPLNYEFLNDIFELNPEEAIEGLQTRTPHGDTPLTMVFASAGEFPGGKHHGPDLNKLCIQVLELLQRYHNGKRIDTNLGTDYSVKCLKGAFTEFDRMIEIDPTPLHEPKSWVSLDQVQLLKIIYPDALSSRVDGRLPLESYITNMLDNHAFLNNSAIKALFPHNLSDLESNETQSLWSLVCCITDDVRVSSRIKHISSEEFETMIVIVFELGAMRSHEEQFKESGLKLLLSNYHFALMPTIRDAIMQTNHWDGLKSSDELSVLFQDVIKNTNIDMMRLLNENGADLHHRVYGQTPFEVAFHARVAIDLCNTEGGAKVLRELLERCSVEETMKDTLRIDEASPLHTLATSEDANGILWLAEALVQHGFDINYVGSGSYAATPLVYHLQQSSLQFAERPLNLGADPFVSGPSFFDGVHTTIATDELAFLQKIANHANETGSSVRWSDPITFRVPKFEVRNFGQKAVISNGTALHVASACNSVACLEYMLNQVSEPEKAFISDEGLSPVHIAAYKGFVDVMKLLLAKGFNAMVESQLGSSPLHMAVMGGHLPIVQFLIEHGAFQTVDVNGMTPGRISSDLGLNEIHEVLEGFPRGGHKQIAPFQELVEFVEPTENWAMEMERAVDENDYERMKKMIRGRGSVDVPLPSSPGLSALLVALDDGNLAMSKWLIGEGASVLQGGCGDKLGKSVIELAAGQKRLNCLLPELFLKYLRQGGDLRFGCEFLFHGAIDEENTKGLEILLEEAEKHLHYIGGADIDGADLNGWTPLMFSQDASTAQHLLSLGASIAAVSRVGSLPSFLVRNGASLTYTSKSGFTSCFLVAGTEAVRKWLLCGRFMDQKRLAAENDADCVQQEVPWGGYIQAKVLLYGRRARWFGESTSDYEKRLSNMKRSWQGKVVRLHVE
ncbi:ankyrin repeat [Fusarium phyllophilum]|uniref:Ankyrin repeat n=1 Tax=Fusarium phyllophilum TaxID=47803 RepID=A0A8H5NIW6_9HYPO|nr:ankyrin repeat [Fusarium phyllophilum]